MVVTPIDEVDALEIRFRCRFTELMFPCLPSDGCESKVLPSVVPSGEANTSAAETTGTVEEEDSYTFEGHSRSIATARC